MKKLWALGIPFFCISGAFLFFAIEKRKNEPNFLEQLSAIPTNQLDEASLTKRQRLHAEKQGKIVNKNVTISNLLHEQQQEDAGRLAEINSQIRKSQSKFQKLSNNPKFQAELDSLAEMNPAGDPPELKTGPQGNIRLVSGQFYAGADANNRSEISDTALRIISAHPMIFGVSSRETPILSSLDERDEKNRR